MKKISVIIPSKNNFLEKNFSIFYTIKSIYYQLNNDIEIIIVNDGGTDSTVEKLSATFPNLIFINEKYSSGGCLAKLRNKGASLASGDVLLFMDDDTIITSPYSFSNITKIAQDYDFFCGASRYWTSIYWPKHVNTKQSISTSIKTLLDISILPKGIDRAIGFRDLNEFTFIGNFGGMRKDIFKSIGGFDERFIGWGLEDTELMMRLSFTGMTHKILSDEELSVIHLTHVSENIGSYRENLRRFNEIEIRNGVYFHINHFFGVYEADGYELFTNIS